MSKTNVCPVCGAGHLTRQSVVEEITYKGVTKFYDHAYSVCDVCQVDQVGAEEMRMNKRSVIRLKKTIDGLLTGDEIRAIRKDWGITQDEASLIFGGGPKAFSKYETDDVVQSESMDKLVRTAAKFPLVFSDLCATAKVTPTAPEMSKVTVQRSVFTWSGNYEIVSAQPKVVEGIH
ncbi:TPA: type II toxin-antitoxin system MqsA family antitoxin [Serratia marcescens]